jgi:hypothetical protein
VRLEFPRFGPLVCALPSLWFDRRLLRHSLLSLRLPCSVELERLTEFPLLSRVRELHIGVAWSGRLDLVFIGLFHLPAAQQIEVVTYSEATVESALPSLHTLVASLMWAPANEKDGNDLWRPLADTPQLTSLSLPDPGGHLAADQSSSSALRRIIQQGRLKASCHS